MKLCVEGATPEQLERGLSLAQMVLTESGFAPYEAARGRFDVDVWDDVHCFAEEHKPPPRTLVAALAWREAERSAIEVCCGRRNAWPDGAHLALTDEDYAQ